ncbi:hypothetical protein CMI37_08750 [Candidatus Pacearchaeota archaeon]|nr:hypothetical protein [Candidatus Pacearchaeota archaeon]
MLKTILLDDNTVRYHQKIISKIETELKFLPKSFWKTSPIISGSYAINLLFKPNAEYNDVDFYFENQNKFLRAKKILEKKSLKKIESKNCVVFKTKDRELEIQLIKKEFLPAKQLIYKHDFKNASIAIQDGNIFIDDELFELYNEGFLSIRSTQIVDGMSEAQKLTKIGNLLNRVAKYMARYELILDKKSVSILKKLSVFLKTIPTKRKRKTLIKTSIYYDNRHNPNQLNLRSFLEIELFLEELLNENQMS